MHVAAWLGLTAFGLAAAEEAAAPSACEHHGRHLVYSQADAPRDVSSLVSELTAALSHASPNGVSAIELEYIGSAIHAEVGHHAVTASVTYAAGEAPRCLVATFVIEDVDECRLPASHAMRHSCHASASCSNTNGSYACSCAAPAALPPACAGAADSSACCGAGDAPCRASFACVPDDPCSVSPPPCSRAAACNSEPGAPLCACPANMLGTGLACPNGAAAPGQQLLVNDLGQALNATLAGSVCGCQVPLVDRCAGHEHECGAHAHCEPTADAGRACVCDAGYGAQAGTSQCVDQTKPLLTLRGAPSMKLKQCDAYRELGVDIRDDNNEDLARTLRIEYSAPLGKRVRDLGDYTVNYTISVLGAVSSVERKVKVVDLNECELQAHSDHACAPRCASEATCVNSQGSYDCRCPTGTAGDGFLRTLADDGAVFVPSTYAGGTGCVDVAAPVIKLAGDAHRVLRVGAATELGHLDRIKRGLPQRDWAAELAALVAADPAALCDAAACFSASDSNPGSARDTDLTGAVVLGAPQPLSPTTFRVPHDVSDAAGNKATTVYRHVEIVESTLAAHAAWLQSAAPTAAAQPAAVAATKAAAKSQRGNKSCPACNCDGQVAAAVAKAKKAPKPAAASAASCPPCAAAAAPSAAAGGGGDGGDGGSSAAASLTALSASASVYAWMLLALVALGALGSGAWREIVPMFSAGVAVAPTAPLRDAAPRAAAPAPARHTPVNDIYARPIVATPRHSAGRRSPGGSANSFTFSGSPNASMRRS